MADKLDEILTRYGGKPEHPNSQQIQLLKEAKQAIKNLIGELIGPHEKPDIDFGGGNYAYSGEAEARNKLRAKLRQKLGEL